MKRFSWIDVLRALAIIFVVIGHTFTTSAIQNYIWSFQVPLFFFISGMLFKDKEEGFVNYLIKKFRSTMVPYYFFGIICILIFAVVGDFAAEALSKSDINTDIPANLLGLLYGSAKTGNLEFNYPLWFLPCMFCVSLIYYGINKLTKKDTKKILLASLIMAIAGYILNYHTSIYGLPLGLDTAVTMTVFYSLGQAYRNEGMKYFNKPYWLVFIVIGWLVSTLNGRVAYSIDQYNNIILFYIASISGIIGYTCLAKLIDHNRVLEFIGQNTMAILVMHKLPIVFFQTVVPVVKTYMAANNLIVGLSVDAFTIAACLTAAVIIKKLMPWALGEKRYEPNRTTSTDF